MLNGYERYERDGDINGTVWLDNVRCNGSENTFFDCPNNGVGTVASNCANHHGDVGVVCTDSEYFILRSNDHVLCMDLLIARVSFEGAVQGKPPKYVGLSP